MWCIRCNTNMKSGTSYENIKGKMTVKRFDECPKCHYRAISRASNTQDPARK